MAVRDMGKRKLGHRGATRGNEWEPEETKADKTGKWEARGEVHEGMCNRSVGKEGYRNIPAGTKQSGGTSRPQSWRVKYQVQRIPGFSWAVPELPGEGNSPSLVNIFPL